LTVMTTVPAPWTPVMAADWHAGLLVGSNGVPGCTPLFWVDRQGRETPIAAPPRGDLYPRLSPDGTRIAGGRTNQEQDIWVWI